MNGSMSDLEALSRLLAGDLDPVSAAALEARLEHDGALRERWEAMQTLAADLDGLEEPVPEGLNQRVLPKTAGSSARWVPWMLVAALLAWMLVPSVSNPVDVHVVSGTQLVEGELTALAGTVPVEIDGRVRISVEPSAEALRVGVQEANMPKQMLLGALAGAGITVAVYEGTARILNTEGDAVVLEAGDTRRIAGKPAVAPRRTVLAPDAPIEEQLAALEAENTALREQLQASNFEAAVTRGQLTAFQGEPMEWPEEVPDGMDPKSFETGLKAMLEAHPDIELITTECSEYPCIALLTTNSDRDGWEEELKGVPEKFAEDQFDDDMGLHVMMGISETDEGAHGTVAFSALPAGPEGPEPEIRTRTDHRSRALMEEQLR